MYFWLGLAVANNVRINSFPAKKAAPKKTTPLRRDCLDLLPHLNSEIMGKAEGGFGFPPFLLFLLPPGHTLQGQGSTLLEIKNIVVCQWQQRISPSAPLCETSRFVAIRKWKRKKIANLKRRQSFPKQAMNK